MSFFEVFGGSAISPASVSYEALTISANTVLAWPIETVGGVPYVAGAIDVTATAGALALQMPPANQGTPGVASLVSNIGSNTFALQDNAGNLIVNIAASQQFLVILTSNGSVAGTWRAYQLAATTSSANAGALAGGGMQAVGSVLQTRFPAASLSANTLLTSGYRANAVTWTGAVGTLSFDTAANLTAGWFCLVQNAGSGVLTLSPTGGALINGQSSVALPIGVTGQNYSAIVVCDGTNLQVFGLIPSPLQIAQGGTGAITAAAALSNFGGTTVGIALFTAASAAAAAAIIGLSSAIFVEKTVSTSQMLGTASGGTAFVCTAALSLTLPLTTTLSTAYYFVAYAQGGAVTVTPNAADAINGLAAAANFVLAQGTAALFVTDAAGNWYPGILANVEPSAVAAGTAQAITAAYKPANTALYDGLTLSFRASAANTATAPTFSPDGLPAHSITKYGGQALVAGDIPGALAQCLVKYDLANTRWELLNPAAGPAAVNVVLLAPASGVTFTVNAFSGTHPAQTEDSATGGPYNMGFLEVPISGGAAKVASYQAVLADSGKTILMNATTLTVTIPANAAVAFPIGTVLTIINIFNGNLLIAITSDTLTLVNSTTTGTRTLAQNGLATLIKVAATAWLITGSGLT